MPGFEIFAEMGPSDPGDPRADWDVTRYGPAGLYDDDDDERLREGIPAWLWRSLPD